MNDVYGADPYYKVQPDNTICGGWPETHHDSLYLTRIETSQECARVAQRFGIHDPESFGVELLHNDHLNFSKNAGKINHENLKVDVK